MTRMRLILGGTVATLVLAVIFLGGALAGSPSRRSVADARTALAPDRLLSGLPLSDTGAQTARLERRVAAQPHDVEGLTLLGLAYQQHARESGFPANRISEVKAMIDPTRSRA